MCPYKEMFMQVSSFDDQRKTQALTFNYERAEQVPAQCLLAAKLLQFQPLVAGNRTLLVEKWKVISLDDWNDVRIFGIFSQNAAKIIGEKAAWNIHEFGGGLGMLEDTGIQPTQKGLELWLYDDKMCSLEKLEEAYSDVYNSMRKGWVESKLENYPTILFTEDPSKYTLFVKNKSLVDEDTLICFLIRKFGLKNQIKCYYQWKGFRNENHKIYIWIANEKLSEVIEKFGFLMEDKNQTKAT